MKGVVCPVTFFPTFLLFFHPTNKAKSWKFGKQRFALIENDFPLEFAAGKNGICVSDSNVLKRRWVAFSVEHIEQV